LVLGSANGPSSLAASMSTAVELLKGLIGDAATNGVHWGSRSILVAVVSHFPEPMTELEVHWGSRMLEVLGSARGADLTEDKADALWI
jgi:hypothetical protein